MKQTATTVDGNWSDYDKVVGKCQLRNYGVIFIDQYGCPIDDEYELEDLAAEYRYTEQ